MPPGTWNSLKIMVHELGFWNMLQLVWKLSLRQAKGEPFSHLPPPIHRKEKESREQIAPAILLYKILREKVGQERAYAITEKLSISGAIAFLSQSIGLLDQKKLAKWSKEERRKYLTEIGDKFPNATNTWDVVEPTFVQFTVTHCTFPTLCKQAGVPELAPVFCQGDKKYFGEVQPNVRLTRPQTIAGGAETCIFQLQWEEKQPATSQELLEIKPLSRKDA